MGTEPEVVSVPHFVRPVTASTDGTVATIAPIDKGAWWERWADASTWRKETEALPGDSSPPEALVEAGRKEWIDKRKKITDENSARHDRNMKAIEDDAVAKKLKKGLAMKTPPLPDASMSDADYTKAVKKPGYNWWVTNANYVLRGGSTKLEELEELSGARSTVEQGWMDRGLTPDFWTRRIDDKCADEINKFRKKLPEKGTTLNHLLEYEPNKEYQKLGALITKLNADLKGPLRQKLSQLQLQLKAAQGKKKPDPDAVANLQTKVDLAQADVDKAVADRTNALTERDALENRGLISSFNGGMNSGSSGKAIDYWEDEARRLGADPGVGDAYYACCAGPKPREGTPPTVVSYDATFSWGAGFNVSSANGWELLRDIATQPTAYKPEERASLSEIWTYFKKCGVYFHPSGTQAPGTGYPIDIVHIEEGSDGKARGYVISNSVQVKTGIHPVWGQNHQETHGAAYEYIRHTPVLMRAFIAAGISDKVPDQQNDDAGNAKDTIATINFRLFCGLHKATLGMPQFIKGRALRIMLIHYMHWGPLFRINTMVLWALSRQLVKAKITLKGGAGATGPLDVKGDQAAADSPSAISMTDVADIEFTPSFDTDVQFARLMGPYAMKVMGGASRAQMAGYWKDFCDDLSEHDGQAALVATLPKYYLQSVDELKASDTSITDAVIESDYATEKIGKTNYVLGKKRDIDAIKAYRSDAEKPPLNALISLLEAHKKSGEKKD